MFRRENPDNPEVLPKITAHYCDVSDPTSVDSCLSEILNKHGKIDHLVTSAGFTENFSAETYPYERIKKLWGISWGIKPQLF